MTPLSFVMPKWGSAELRCGGLAELADADGSKSSDRKVMGVQTLARYHYHRFHSSGA